MMLDTISDLNGKYPVDNFLVAFDFHKNHKVILEEYASGSYTGLVLQETTMPPLSEKSLEHTILEIFHLLPQDVVFEWTYARKKLH